MWKGKGIIATSNESKGGGVCTYVQLYSFLKSALDGDGGEFNALAPLFSGKNLATNCTGGWVGPWASLDR
jgi:hypothetical protein